MLTDEEKKTFKKQIKRDMSSVEEAVLESLWSEHCSYKSSKRWFKLFNKEGRRVVLGIGEGAGLVDVGDDFVIGLGIESRNHPSSDDPYEGAATGVGGIIRDILSQGCKPIALLDCLRFGTPSTDQQKLLLDKVVMGISLYGNCVGIPNLGGDMEFSDEFETNPLVNAMCVGVAKKEDIIRSIASSPDDLLFLYGSKTCMDGKGVTSSSKKLAGKQQDKDEGSVQIDYPLSEKLLIDVTLELRDNGLLNGLQDIGGGGLACAAIEMSEKGKTGLFVDLIKVHGSMQPLEILVSESRERMLGIVNPENIDKAMAIVEKFGLVGRIIGRVEEGDHFIASNHENIEAFLPINFTINGIPEPKRETKDKPVKDPSSPIIQGEKHPLLELLGTYNLASRKPIYQQYDQHVQGNTVYGPGLDAGVVRLPNEKFLALAAGSNSYMISCETRIGTSLATLGVIRSVIARGGEAIALVDSINAGNPENTSSYTEFVNMIKGIADVSHAFNVPVVGGNVSLYNEVDVEGKTKKILSGAFIGIAGLIEKEQNLIQPTLKPTKSKIYLLGSDEGFLHGSEYHRNFGGETEVMKVDFDEELRVANVIAQASKFLTSATDVGRGGLMTTLAKWSIQSNIGIEFIYETDDLAFLWGEYGARYLVQIEPSKETEFLKMVAQNEVELSVIARTSKIKKFKISEKETWDLHELRKIWEEPLKKALQSK